MAFKYFNIPIRRGSATASLDYITAVQLDLPYSILNSEHSLTGNQIFVNEMPFEEPTFATNILSDVLIHQSDFGFTYPVPFSAGSGIARYYSKDGQGLFRFDSYAQLVNYAPDPRKTVSLVGPKFYRDTITTMRIICDFFMFTNEDIEQGKVAVYLAITSDNIPIALGYGQQGIYRNITDNTFWSFSSNYTRFSTVKKGGDDSKTKITYLFDGIQEDIQERYPNTDPNNGTYNPNDESDAIDTPIIPAINSSVFTHVYKMNPSLLATFKNELFSDNFWDNIKKWFTKPMDSIVALNIVPLALNEISSLQNIQVGTRSMDAQGYLASGTVFKVDCGFVDIDEYYGNFADYEQTIIQCYVPYVGFIPIKTVDVMGGKLRLEYMVNIVTGDFVAFLKVERNKFNVNLSAVLYETCGNMFAQIPVTSSDYSNIITGLMNTITSTVTTTASALTGNVAGMVAGSSNVVQSATQMISAPAIQRSGSFNKNASICTMRKPFVLLERPRIAIPSTMQSEKGFTANYSAKLSDLTGYTEVRECTIENIPNATKEEKDLIMSALKNGVYL